MRSLDSVLSNKRTAECKTLGRNALKYPKKGRMGIWGCFFLSRLNDAPFHSSMVGIWGHFREGQKWAPKDFSWVRC